MVSIVMPSMNHLAFIEASIDSVLTQNYSPLELIVVDGGSTDGTVEWLVQRQANDMRLRWISEADTGPADALNKGLRLTRGTIIGWLNSDDMYTADAVLRSVEALSEHREWLMVYGHGEHVDVEGGIIDRYPTLEPSNPLQTFADGCFICQPTVFFRRTMWMLQGDLDDSLKTAFDFEYWLRAFKKFPGRIGFINNVQAYSRLHADCLTMRMRGTVALEGMQVIGRYLDEAPCHWAITYIDELLSINQFNLDVEKEIQVFVEKACQYLSYFEQQKLNNYFEKIKNQ